MVATRRRHLRTALVAFCALAGVALAVATPVIWLAVSDPFGGPPHPTDAALLAQFREKRGVLEQLAEMAALDPGLQRLAPDFTRPEHPEAIGIAADRIALYRRLCIEAGIRQGFSHYGRAVELLVNTRGLAISGSSKGFVHRVGPDPDATVVDTDLDVAAAALAKQRDVVLQRRIEGDWWLQLDRR
jgi:hypothetical protein